MCDQCSIIMFKDEESAIEWYEKLLKVIDELPYEASFLIPFTCNYKTIEAHRMMLNVKKELEKYD